jgi:hypothetical protein
MKLMATKEDAMRPTTLLSPLIAAERRVIAAEKRHLEIDPGELADAFEIDEEEILDDLQYPADHRAMQRPVDMPAGRNGQV